MTDPDRNGMSRSLLDLLHRASQCAKEIFDTRIPALLTPRQLAVMMAVADNEGLSQTAVVERTGIDPKTSSWSGCVMLKVALCQGDEGGQAPSSGSPSG
jgi:hypothetical protein